jgi:hypothetical protein
MTERAALSGGWLRAGPDDGRFVVTAWLPYQPTGSHAPIVTATQEEPAR